MALVLMFLSNNHENLHCFSVSWCECNALELCESDHVGAAFKFINHKRMPPTI